MSKHFRRFTQLHKKSEKAVGVFLSTERELKVRNEQLDILIDDLEKDMSQLSAVWHEAKAKKEDNKKVIERIGEIVGS